MTVTSPAFRIETATERDVPLILELIKALSVYERLAHEVTATEAQLRKTLFGPNPSAEVLIGYAGDEPAGFALFFANYSTFLGKPGIHLEDLFVKPEWRGHGFGRQLLERFYKKLGATLMEEWSTFRVTGDALRRLGSGVRT